VLHLGTSRPAFLCWCRASHVTAAAALVGDQHSLSKQSGVNLSPKHQREYKKKKVARGFNVGIQIAASNEQNSSL